MSGRTAPLAQRGLTLIELMVALVLGLLLLAVVGQVYLADKTTFTAQQQQGLMQEGGRFALEFLARDARMAGLAGCSSRRPLELPLPLRSYLSASGYPFDPLQGVQGHEAADSGPGDTIEPDPTPAASGDASDWSPALPAGTHALADTAVAGSDVLVLSGMDAGVPLVSPFTSGAQIFVASTSGFAPGDILMVTDCQQAQLFQATGVTAASGNIVGSSAGGYSPGNASPITERGPAGPFQEGSEVAHVRTYAYYVGVGSDGDPALVRERLQGGSSAGMAAEELVGGVESLQVLYGVDGNMDFVVDQYVTADAVADWRTVRALQVALLLRTPDEFGPDLDEASYDLAGTTLDPVDDRRVRRVFTSTIALRNRLL